jgi:hypothetical protein
MAGAHLGVWVVQEPLGREVSEVYLAYKYIGAMAARRPGSPTARVMC